MATYKVPQDVEAEDKFLGPLTFKQFLFAGGAAVSGYILFLFLSRGVWLGFIFVFPIFAVFAILAFPWSKDQPTEIWLASRIRFLIVPRRRIWDQTGIKDLVEITVPKKEAKIFSDGLSREQVYSRVNALATVVDTRGWAVKNVIDQYRQQAPGATDQSDRLVAAPAVQEADEKEQIVASTVDVMDESSSPIASQFTNLMHESEERHRKETEALIEEARHASDAGEAVPDASNISSSPAKKDAGNLHDNDLWFLHEQPATKDPNLVHFQDNAVVRPGESKVPLGMGVPVTNIKEADEAKLLEQVHQRQARDRVIQSQSHLKTIQPLSDASQSSAASTVPPIVTSDDFASMSLPAVPAASVPPVDPAILALSTNDDLTVETLARQAKKDKPDDGEVVISLR